MFPNYMFSICPDPLGEVIINSLEWSSLVCFFLALGAPQLLRVMSPADFARAFWAQLQVLGPEGVTPDEKKSRWLEVFRADARARSLADDYDSIVARFQELQLPVFREDLQGDLEALAQDGEHQIVMMLVAPPKLGEYICARESLYSPNTLFLPPPLHSSFSPPSNTNARTIQSGSKRTASARNWAWRPWRPAQKRASSW